MSGTPGLRPDGTRPEDFAEEARQASDNVCEALRCAGAEPSDIVQVRSWLTARGDIDAYVITAGRRCPAPPRRRHAARG
ncbi:RidA family protein [Streptomyces mirabilis]|uniref:RidA family protein n=1 Tax=Streptomyces mirabilis TaxID=68239 RepID=UPI0036663956